MMQQLQHLHFIPDIISRTSIVNWVKLIYTLSLVFLQQFILLLEDEEVVFLHSVK